MARRHAYEGIWMQSKERGAALRRSRERAQLSQRELGLLVKCSGAFIGQLERAESSVGDKLAVRIAKRLGRDVEDLFEDRPVTSLAGVATGALTTSSRS